jgi:pimeloyl-ACP methyl ester carboxylesterase
VEVGEGDPIVLLHGNPTSSYLWRNVLPHLQPRGRCIAPDLISMGDSDKLPDSGPGSYRFVEHRRYLDALLESLDVHERVTFVVHDWGSALGFDWANRHREAVKGIAYMEAIVQPQAWDHWDKLNMRPVLKALRSEAGEAMVLQDNFFIERILPKAVLRTLSVEEMAEYRRPFAEPGEGRRPTLTWPRQIPIEGEPADATAIASLCGLAGDERCTQAVREGRARFARRRRRESRLRPRVASADRGDGRGGPLPPGRFAGRDRAGHRRLDGGVGLIRQKEPTMRHFINLLVKIGILKKDLDYHLIRASLVIIFLFFGYQKWFQYEAQALLPYISNGPLIFWMYPVFGIRGATYFLGVAEWLFGGLLFLGFWNKKLGILGALGACFSFIATFTIIPFMPDGWAVSAGGFPAMTEKVAFLMKDLVLFAASFYLLKQDVARVALSREGSGEFQKRAFLKTSHGRV